MGNGNAYDSYHLRFPLQVQLLLVTMVAEFLAMGNGNAYDQLPPASWDAAPAPGY